MVTNGEYVRVNPEDLLHLNRGFLRYAVDTIEDGVVNHKYGCGYLLAVDPNLRYLQLVLRKYHWTLKLDNPERRIRLYFREKKTAAEEEVEVFRKLLQQLENGEIEIVKKKNVS